MRLTIFFKGPFGKEPGDSELQLTPKKIIITPAIMVRPFA